MALRDLSLCDILAAVGSSGGLFDWLGDTFEVVDDAASLFDALFDDEGIWEETTGLLPCLCFWPYLFSCDIGITGTLLCCTAMKLWIIGEVSTTTITFTFHPNFLALYESTTSTHTPIGLIDFALVIKPADIFETSCNGPPVKCCTGSARICTEVLSVGIFSTDRTCQSFGINRDSWRHPKTNSWTHRTRRR